MHDTFGGFQKKYILKKTTKSGGFCNHGNHGSDRFDVDGTDGTLGKKM